MSKYLSMWNFALNLKQSRFNKTEKKHINNDKLEEFNYYKEKTEPLWANWIKKLCETLGVSVS